MILTRVVNSVFVFAIRSSTFLQYAKNRARRPRLSKRPMHRHNYNYL